MAAVWVCAALVVTKYGSDSNDQNVARKDWRNAVIFLCWLNALLFTIQVRRDVALGGLMFQSCRTQ